MALARGETEKKLALISKFVYTLTTFDMRSCHMKLLKFFSKEPRVEFCDACASVCDEGCRVSEARGLAVERALGGRFRL